MREREKERKFVERDNPLEIRKKKWSTWILDSDRECHFTKAAIRGIKAWQTSINVESKKKRGQESRGVTSKIMKVRSKARVVIRCEKARLISRNKRDPIGGVIFDIR